MSRIIWCFFLVALCVLNFAFAVDGFKDGEVFMPAFNGVISLILFVQIVTTFYRYDDTY